MTGPAVVQNPPHVLTGDEWEAAQYGPQRQGQDPTKPMGAGRILTGDEWEKGQAAGSFKTLTFPAMPKIASDRLNPTLGSPGQRPTGGPTPEQIVGGGIRTAAAGLDIAGAGLNPAQAGVTAAIGRQVLAPAVENPAMTAAMVNPIGAIIGTGMAAHTIAKYGWQVAHEHFMSPADRAKAEADPDRVSGEAAAVQAVMLGLGALAGVHHIAKAADVGEGMVEVGASDMARASAGTSPTDPQMAAARAAEGRAGVVLQGLEGLKQSAAERAQGLKRAAAERASGIAAEPIAEPVVPTQGGRVEEAPAVPTVGQADDIATVPRVGRGREATDLTEEQRSGKEVPVVEPQTFSAGGRESRLPGSVPRAYFSTPKGADVLGTAAAVHGLPETANPFPPGSPLGQAWDGGHAVVTGGAEGAGLPYRGPAGLYDRLSDDALSAEYRALLEKRSSVEPSAQAPLWTPEREALAVEQIENRRRPDGSLASADKARLARLQLEQGEGYYTGRHTFESAAAERRLAAVNKHIAAIEKEMAGRGLKPEDAMQPTASGEGGSLPPVEGTGETRTRGLSAGVEQKAMAHEMDPMDVLPEYRQVNMADQAAKAGQLVTENPELARKIATGEAQAPAGLLPESVFTAVENKALNEGDVATIRDLASGKLTEQATTMGQRLRALAERDPESPVAAIQKIEDVRGGGSEEGTKAVNDMATELQKETAKAHPDVLNETSLTKLINSLRC